MTKQLDAKLTGFSKGLLVSFKGDYEAFKKWYDPKYRNVSAGKIWESIGGKIPKKKDQENI